MKKIFITLLALSILIGGGIFFLLDNSAQESNTAKQAPTNQLENELPIGNDDTEVSVIPTIGNSDSGVKIIEFVDYKCPNCNRFHRGVGEELKTTFIDSGEAFIEVRQLPFIGPDSRRAANGAYCAAAVGVFPEYNDAVFDYMWGNYYESSNFQAEFEDILTTDRLVELVAPNLADQDAFRTCIDEATFDSSVEADLDLGQDNGVRGTPSFIIGGRTLSNQQPLSVFESLIKLEQ